MKNTVKMKHFQVKIKHFRVKIKHFQGVCYRSGSDWNGTGFGHFAVPFRSVPFRSSWNGTERNGGILSSWWNGTERNGGV